MVNGEPPTTFRQKFARTLLRLRWWITVPLLILLIAAAIPLSIRYRRLSQVPEIDIPYPTAGINARIPNEGNAYLLLKEAFEAYQEGDPLTEEQRIEQDVDGWQPGDHLQDAYLKQNEKALALWLQAAARDDYQEPPWEWDADINESMIGVQHHREFVRLAVSKHQKLTATGNADEALPWLAGVYRMSGLVTRQSDMMNRTVGIAIHAIATEETPAWLSHSRTSRRDILMLRDAVIASESLRADLSTSLKIKHLRNDAYNRELTYEEYAQFYRSISPQPLSRWEFWLQAEPEFSRRVNAHVLANQLSHLGTPRRARPSIVYKDLFDGPTSILPADQRLSANRIHELRESAVFSDGIEPLSIELRLEARQACVLVAIAAHLHHHDHRRFPDTLADLVPKYLPTAPDDPYSTTPAPTLYAP